ncbi:Gfo/Idh/MocA family oxidoreductase [Acinetobacter soli]
MPLDEVDGVLIHSTTSAHADQVGYVLERGVHVFIDKPVTFSLDETERVRAPSSNGACRRRGRNPR